MSAEQVVITTCSHAEGMDCIKAALFNRFYAVQTVINAQLIMYGAPCMISRCKVFISIKVKTLHPNNTKGKQKALAFMLFCVIQYALIIPCNNRSDIVK